MKKSISHYHILSICFFTLLGLFSLHVPFSMILGSSARFTLFDFIAPTIGAFIGLVPAVFIVLITQFINIIILHTPIDTAAILHLIPVLFAVVYFSKRQKSNFFIPALAIILFNLNPIGRSAGLYSLFWFIPMITYFFPKNLFLKSLGATFSAHAVGGVLWVWAFGLSKEIWLALIPQTAVERLLMAGGITASYLILNKAIQFILARKIISIHSKTASTR